MATTYKAVIRTQRDSGVAGSGSTFTAYGSSQAIALQRAARRLGENIGRVATVDIEIFKQEKGGE